MNAIRLLLLFCLWALPLQAQQGLRLSNPGFLGITTPAVPGVAADIYLDYGLASAGLLTPAKMASTVVNGSGWTYSGFNFGATTGATLNHNYIGTAFSDTRPPVAIGGVNYSGSGSGGYTIDITSRAGSDAAWEGIKMFPPVGFTHNGEITISGLVQFCATGDPVGAGTSGMDVVSIYSGGFAIIQEASGFVRAHSSAGFGPNIPITVGKVYFFALKSSTSAQKAMVMIIDNTTGQMVGYSEVINGSGVTLSNFQWGDYSIAWGQPGGSANSTHRRKAEAIHFGANADLFPCRTYTIAAPTTLLAVQSGISTSAVTWSTSGTGFTYRLERTSNGGSSWTVLGSGLTALSYADTVTNGTSYQYRLYATFGGVESLPQTTTSLPIDNSTYLATTTIARANLLREYVADTITGSDFATLSTWPDTSGNGQDATSTLTARPTLRRGTVNGHSSVRFDATAHNYMQAPLLSGSSLTVVVAVQINTAAASWTVLSTEANNHYWRFNGDSAGYMGLFRPTGARINSYPAVMPSSGVHIFTVRSTSSTYQMWIDGDPQPVKTANFSAGTEFVIGASNVGGATWFPGDISEMLIYSGETDANRQAVEDYMGTKYGRVITH